MAHIDGVVQDCSIFSALAMEMLQSCTKPSIYALMNLDIIASDNVFTTVRGQVITGNNKSLLSVRHLQNIFSEIFINIHKNKPNEVTQYQSSKLLIGEQDRKSVWSKLLGWDSDLGLDWNNKPGHNVLSKICDW